MLDQTLYRDVSEKSGMTIVGGNTETYLWTFVWKRLPAPFLWCAFVCVYVRIGQRENLWRPPGPNGFRDTEEQFLTLGLTWSFYDYPTTPPQLP